MGNLVVVWADKEGNIPCGSDYVWHTDLKTYKGIVRRCNKNNIKLMTSSRLARGIEYCYVVSYIDWKNKDNVFNMYSRQLISYSKISNNKTYNGGEIC